MSRARRAIAIVVAIAIAGVIGLLLHGRLAASPSARATGSAPGAHLASPTATQTRSGAAGTAAAPVRSESGTTSSATVPTAAECDQACGLGVECRFDDRGGIACPKECSSSADCAATELCRVFVSPDDHDHAFKRCVGSNCNGLGDKDNCGEHATCVFSGRLEGGVFRCEPAGTRTKGQTCTDAVDSTAGLCAKGLSCVDGLCAPTSCQSDAECPKGTRCHGVAAGTHKECAADCATDEECPTGDRCATTRWGRRCVDRADPASCLESGCSAGLSCVVEFMAPLRASCHKACAASNDASCAKNEFCAVLGGDHYCVRKCRVAADCAAGGSCIDFPDGTRGCGVDPDALTRDYLARQPGK